MQYLTSRAQTCSTPFFLGGGGKGEDEISDKTHDSSGNSVYESYKSKLFDSDLTLRSTLALKLPGKILVLIVGRDR